MDKLRVGLIVVAVCFVLIFVYLLTCLFCFLLWVSRGYGGLVGERNWST